MPPISIRKLSRLQTIGLFQLRRMVSLHFPLLSVLCPSFRGNALFPLSCSGLTDSRVKCFNFPILLLPTYLASFGRCSCTTLTRCKGHQGQVNGLTFPERSEGAFYPAMSCLNGAPISRSSRLSLEYLRSSRWNEFCSALLLQSELRA